MALHLSGEILTTSKPSMLIAMAAVTFGSQQMGFPPHQKTQASGVTQR
jgi:hypothetical protein